MASMAAFSLITAARYFLSLTRSSNTATHDHENATQGVRDTSTGTEVFVCHVSLEARARIVCVRRYMTVLLVLDQVVEHYERREGFQATIFELRLEQVSVSASALMLNV